MRRVLLRISDLSDAGRVWALALQMPLEAPASELFLKLLPEVPKHGEAKALAAALGVDQNTVYKWVERAGRGRAYFHAAEGKRRARAEARERAEEKRRAKHQQIMKEWREGNIEGRKADDRAASLRRIYGAQAVPYRNYGMALAHAQRRTSPPPASVGGEG